MDWPAYFFWSLIYFQRQYRMLRQDETAKLIHSFLAQSHCSFKELNSETSSELPKVSKQVLGRFQPRLPPYTALPFLHRKRQKRMENAKSKRPILSTRAVKEMQGRNTFLLLQEKHFEGNRRGMSTAPLNSKLKEIAQKNTRFRS